jgi:hypothetical protein
MALKITLTRGEGPIVDCDKPHICASFKEANDILSRWSNTAPEHGGYDKCDFRIELDGEEVYSGRYDLKHWRVESANLLAHVAGYLEFISGPRPEDMGEQNWAALQRNLAMTPERRQEAQDLIKRFRELANGN